MDLRRLFSSHIWWGKILGAFLGYLIAGPTGALFGILIGNFFDRGLHEHFTRPHWGYHQEKRQEVRLLFFEATFSILGLIAKADGHVSKNEIHMAQTIMQELGLNHAQKMAAQRYFNDGKKPGFNLNLLLVRLRSIFQDNPTLLKLFFDIQYRAAQVDGLSFKKQEIFNHLLRTMGYAPLHRQYQFYEDFLNQPRHQSQQTSSEQTQSQYQHHYHRRTHSPRRTAIDEAYALLDVTPATSKQDVKRAYRRLMSLNHPDKLMAKGATEALIKKANEKTQAISKAYELICATKGW